MSDSVGKVTVTETQGPASRPPGRPTPDSGFHLPICSAPLGVDLLERLSLLGRHGLSFSVRDIVGSFPPCLPARAPTALWGGSLCGALHWRVQCHSSNGRGGVSLHPLTVEGSWSSLLSLKTRAGGSPFGVSKQVVGGMLSPLSLWGTQWSRGGHYGLPLSRGRAESLPGV